MIKQTFSRGLLADRRKSQNTAKLLEFEFTIMFALQVIHCFSSQFHGSNIIVTLANTDGGYKRAENIYIYTHTLCASCAGPCEVNNGSASSSCQSPCWQLRGGSIGEKKNKKHESERAL